jgi:OOP family OmpA-OmpF porin
MGPALAGGASKFLGESESTTQAGLGALLPAILGGMMQKTTAPGGASSLMSMITGSNIDTSLLGNITGALAGGPQTSNLLNVGSSRSSWLFGDRLAPLSNAVFVNHGDAILPHLKPYQPGVTDGIRVLQEIRGR